MLHTCSYRRATPARAAPSGWRPPRARSTGAPAHGPTPPATNAGWTTAGPTVVSEGARTPFGALRQLRVLGEEARGIARFGQLPIGLSSRDRCVVDDEIEPQVWHVDANAITVFYESDGPTVDGF